MEGIHFIVVALGMFGIAEVLSEAERIWKTGLGGGREQITGRYWITWSELKESFMPYVRGTILGFFVGVLPGAGGTTATFLSYGMEKQISKHPEKFGKGAIEGVAGPEAANNASSEGALVPLFTLGIPGSATTAVMLGAFVMYGLKPGPLLFENNPDLIWAIIASLYIGNVMLIILNLPLVNVFAKILDLPEAVLQSSVLAFCVLGVYSMHFAVSDVFLMILFGIIGYFARKHHYPAAPLLLAVVLGDMMEQGFRRSLAISNGDWSIFVTRPITLGILIAVVVSLAYSFIKFYWRRPKVKDSKAQ
jgi:putative tricarboxylic transport membrane protein